MTSLLQMLIDQINLNQLRIFECVYKSKSMTVAADELHLTQSGVSQHIKTLEDVLGIRLFDRIRQRLIPTKQASELFEKCSKSLQDIEATLNHLKEGEKHVAGTVSIGFPIQFGNNLIIPLIAEFSKQFPLVRFRLRQGFPALMNELLLSGDLDFAFVDSFAMDPAIQTKPIYNERLELYYCPTSEPFNKLNISHTKDFYESLSYIDYQEDQSVLRLWMAHHLKVKSITLKVRAYVMDAQAVARLILSGLGAGVLPSHLASHLEKEGKKIEILPGSGDPFYNSISIASLKERTQPFASKTLRDFLEKRLAASQKAKTAS